jgi:hypothetical protein
MLLSLLVPRFIVSAVHSIRAPGFKILTLLALSQDVADRLAKHGVDLAGSSDSRSSRDSRSRFLEQMLPGAAARIALLMTQQQATAAPAAQDGASNWHSVLD